LVSIMHANNEVGSIQPIREMARLAHAHGALFHTDAAQSTGKIPVNVDDMEVDLLSIAGHKVYAPAGIGVLYVRNSTCLEKLMHGAGHEAGRRPGTENLLEITGLGAACEIAGADLEKNMAHYKSTRDLLETGLIDKLGHKWVHVNGHPEKRLPNTSSLSFYKIKANKLLESISSGVSASAGAACHAGDVHISAVLQAMHVPMDWAMGTLRFSTGRGTSPEQINSVIEKVAQVVEKLG
jgi:cysteine desulfurase